MSDKLWKQHKRNPVARDLAGAKYGPRIRETKRQHMIDELHRQECDEEYWFWKELGLGNKE